MRKSVAVVFLSFVVFFALGIPAFAFDADSYFDEYSDIAPDGFGDPDEILNESGATDILEMLGDAFSAGVGDAVSFFAMLMGISAIYAVYESFCEKGTESNSRIASAGITAVSSILIISRLLPLVFSVRSGMKDMCSFFSALIPITTGILAAGGSVNSAATQAFNMNLTLGAIDYAASELLIPLVFAMLALSVTAGLGAGTVSTLAKWLKSCFLWLIGILTTVIIGAVSMQSMISSAKDSAYLRGAKYAASGMIPVVGGVVASALSSLAGGLAYAKSVIGVSAVFAIVGFALTPLVTLLLYRLAISLAGSFLELMGAEVGSKCFHSYRSCLDALVAVYALSAFAAIFEIFVFMKSGVDLLG